MASLALQKLDVKDLVCLPLYKKLSPGQTLTGSAPNLSPRRTQSAWSAAQGTPYPTHLARPLEESYLDSKRGWANRGGYGET